MVQPVEKSNLSPNKTKHLEMICIKETLNQELMTKLCHIAYAGLAGAWIKTNTEWCTYKSYGDPANCLNQSRPQ